MSTNNEQTTPHCRKENEDKRNLQLAALALSLSVQEWSQLGLPSSSSPRRNDLEGLVERVTALVLVKCEAIVHPREYPDLSTVTICRDLLVRQLDAWPAPITNTIVHQIRQFVHSILSRYRNLPYHNREHAYHVVLSTNKMLDMILSQNQVETFGLRQHPLAIFSLLFAALIHDVDHHGVPNRQLAKEKAELSILYNDQSIAENRSLYLAFSEFLKDDYKEWREAIFLDDEDVFFHFRKRVIELVLSTDIASPERTQLSKSKWKEAFGAISEQRRQSFVGSDTGGISVDNSAVSDDDDGGAEDDQFDAGEDYEPLVMEPEPDSVNNDTENANNDTEVDIASSLESPHLSSQGSGMGTPVHSGLRRRVPLRAESDDSRGSRTVQRQPRNASMPFMSRNPSYYRRLSMPNGTKGFRKRLGIRRSMDLTGEALETYSRSSTSLTTDAAGDEYDEFKASVVMETILTAADVAHNLQGWQQMIKWSSNLYFELVKAFAEGRGADPHEQWFENQIGFLESYLMPLARRLDEMGVFGEVTGVIFMQTVQSNRSKWLVEGFPIVQELIRTGDQMVAKIHAERAAAKKAEEELQRANDIAAQESPDTKNGDATATQKDANMNGGNASPVPNPAVACAVVWFTGCTILHFSKSTSRRNR